MLAPQNADLSHCARNPTDPTCSGLQEKPVYAQWVGYYTAPGISPPTPTTTKTPGAVPGQQVTTSSPPIFAVPGFYSAEGSPWYKTWWGLGLIGVGAFLGYKRFIAKK